MRAKSCSHPLSEGLGLIHWALHSGGIMLRLAPILTVLFILALPAQSAPTDEMFENLLSAESDEAAAKVEADIWASWVESGSGTVDLLMERALEAIQFRRPDLARELLDRVILIKPDYAEAWNRRAGLFLADEAYEQAVRDLNETLRLEPRHFGAWTVLGRILEQLGAGKEALEAYREALKIHPRMDAARRAENRLSRTSDGQSL